MDLAVLLPLIKLAIVFGVVILLLRLSSQVGLALGLGAVTLGLVFSMSPMEILDGFGLAMVDGPFLLVVLIVTMILILSASMERLGQTEELLRRFKAWVGDKRWGLVAFPALIGLLPMPGGAVFSAPMLDSFDSEKRLAPSLKSFLNYWYRHIWEYWWPLYPGLILACAIADLDLWHYILLAFPMTAVAVAGGLPQLMQVPRIVRVPSTENDPIIKHTAWRDLCPLLLTILPGVGFAICLRFFGTNRLGNLLPRELGLVIGLFAAVVWAWRDRGIRPDQIREILLDQKLFRMWLTLAGVFVFKGVMERSGAAQEVGRTLAHLEIPVVSMVILLPLILGTISGLPIAFVGVAFPILVPLIQTMGTLHMQIPLTILAYVSGFTGALLSPLHLCLILSNEYFEAPWPSVYHRLWLPLLTILGGGIGYVWVLTKLLA